ncbi:hypothetical protein HP397_01595 [Streptobacillus felis]|uniref:HEAT repeat domain-containing protein n=2 Tax=Streptobacillus felis TaxID=1384509 RepID=A0A7Z0PE65_9FUSO|nr:hypothetical protein [Streptobacillus felis]NYV27522.1 hypothetical protein [Streptobacillus felis]
MLELFKELKFVKSDRWAVGNAIGEIGDKTYVDEYIKIINDRSNGRDRQMIVYFMYRFKEKKVKEALLGLLDDEEVNGHALYALGMFKDYSLIEKIKLFLSHKITFKRTIAKRAIAKLEKQKNLEST